MTAVLSILMPTYNGAAYCDPQIDSILNQSFDDFELLIVDDGSTDDTAQKLIRAAARDKRIRLLPADGRNCGQRTRLLQLLDRAEGRVIGFADQDDIWPADKLERLIEGLADAGMAFGASHLIDETGRETGQTLHSAAKLPIRPNDRLWALAHPLVSAHGMIVRRELVSQAAFCSTAPFDWLIALDVQYGSTIRYIEGAITLHRVHSANQNNGDLLDAHVPLDWKSRLCLPRNLLPSGNLDRFSFWRRAAYLAHSPVVGSEVRRAFAILCGACEEAWFVKAGPYHQARNVACQAILLEQLRPFAGSAQDWTDCESMVAVLTANWRTRNSRYMSR
jgi:glycosyltransferase involved in cell wall biosynthesis